MTNGIANGVTYGTLAKQTVEGKKAGSKPTQRLKRHGHDSN